MRRSRNDYGVEHLPFDLRGPGLAYDSKAGVLVFDEVAKACRLWSCGIVPASGSCSRSKQPKAAQS